MATPSTPLSSTLLTQEKIEEAVEQGSVYFNLFVVADDKLEKCYVGYQTEKNTAAGPKLLYPASKMIPQDSSAVLKLAKTADNKAYVISSLIHKNTFLECLTHREPAVFRKPPADKPFYFRQGQRFFFVRHPSKHTKFALFATIESKDFYLKPESGVVHAAQSDSPEGYYNFSLITLPYFGDPIGPLDTAGVSEYSQRDDGVFEVRISDSRSNYLIADIVNNQVTYKEAFSNPNTSTWMRIKQTDPTRQLYVWSNFGAPEDFVAIIDRIRLPNDWRGVELQAAEPGETPFFYQIMVPRGQPNSTDLGFYSSRLNRYLLPVVLQRQNTLVGTRVESYPFNLYFRQVVTETPIRPPAI